MSGNDAWPGYEFKVELDDGADYFPSIVDRDPEVSWQEKARQESRVQFAKLLEQCEEVFDDE
jgi:hypothetical protein